MPEAAVAKKAVKNPALGGGSPAPAQEQSAPQSNSWQQEAMRQMQQGGPGVMGETVGVDAALLRMAYPEGTAVTNPKAVAEHEQKGMVEYGQVKGTAFARGQGDRTAVNANDVNQGYLGNCYLHGAMAAVARANPNYIKNLIKENGDGTYDVTLYIRKDVWSPTGSPVTVTVDSSFPMRKGRVGDPLYGGTGDSNSKGPELWMMLIEKAWAYHKGGYENIEGSKVNNDGKFGGAMALLTGKTERYIDTNLYSEAQLAQLIDEALKNKYSVACDSRNMDKESATLKADADKAGVVGNHAYAPEKIDVSGMKMDLQNPWGSSHVKGLALKDFKRFYRGLRICK